jgi:HPt (histidine-containing phosphotransfer) domain-containing protein
MIRTFLRDTLRRMARLRKALKRRDSEAVASLAHSIKGSVAFFGAETARLQAQQLHDRVRQSDLRGVARILSLLEEEIAKMLANLRGYANKRSLREQPNGQYPGHR